VHSYTLQLTSPSSTNLALIAPSRAEHHHRGIITTAAVSPSLEEIYTEPLLPISTMSLAGFRRFNLRKSRKSRKSAPAALEPVPVSPVFQHPHYNLPDPALAALRADGWNLEFALSGPVWDHTLSNQFGEECLTSFQTPTASRPETPSPPPSMRSSQISPKTVRPVTASKQKKKGQRKDSHVGHSENGTGDQPIESPAGQKVTPTHIRKRQITLLIDHAECTAHRERWPLRQRYAL